MSAPNKLLAAAKEYAKLGWRVFPILSITAMGGCECGDPDCARPGKHPAIKGWPTEATVDVRKITAWWSEFPERGIGIATGEGSGLTVLDVDGEEGVAALGKLAAGVGMPPTPCVTTRPGRYHYYFRYIAEVKSNAGKLGEKLDTRGDGGYVVAPPSRHVSGGPYAWIQDPWKVELADWPDFLKAGGSKKAAGSKAGRPSKEQFNPANTKEVARLKDALSFVDPDNEEHWSQIGWILGRAYRQSDGGFAVYSAWAARSRKYDAKKTKQHYYERSKEVRGADIKTTASIYAWAVELGWEPENVEEREEREYHVFENPYREETMIHEFITAAAASPAIFVMDKRLVRIIHYGASGSADPVIERDPTAFVLLDHDVDTLAVELGNVAAYWTKGAKGHKRAGFSRGAIKTFISYRQFKHGMNEVKPLEAFVPHPTVRANGTLITKVGYDAPSRLFLTSEVSGLKIDSRLTAAGAKKAMALLLDPFSEYPWATDVDRAVFVAALFTVGLRHLFDVAPLFAFSSPKHGSGKTQLAECLSRLWYGITLSKATWTGNPEEMEKRIAAFLLAGDRMVCLDNVTEGMRLEDSTLNKVLTSRRNTFRLLGHTERVELTNEATWFATGNQLMLSGDISRRALVCYVDAKVVDPSARSFKIPNLPRYVAAHRPELMSAALSIVTSWMCAGRPIGSAPHREYGSFTGWYELIRPLLLWAGEADIAVNLDQITEEDSEGMALEAFANELRKQFPPDGTRLTTMEAVRLIAKADSVRAAFAGCTRGTEKDPNVYTIAGILRRCENKIFISDNPGHKFTINKRKDERNNQFVWGVEER